MADTPIEERIAEIERKMGHGYHKYPEGEVAWLVSELRAALAREAEIGTMLDRAHARDPEWHEMIMLLKAEVARLREALTQAEACMSIVEPRSDKAEYLRILDVVRQALAPREPTKE